MNFPSTGQVNAGLRHVGTVAGTSVAIFSILGVLSPDQSASILAGVHQVTDGLYQTFGGLSKLIVIIGPIAAVYFGKGAVTSASLKKQLAAITSNPNVKIEGQIVVPASIAAAVPSDKVVAPKTP